MPQDPRPSPPERLDERPTIIGLETEHLVFFVADEGADGRRPPFALIEDLVYRLLLEGRKAARSSGSKRGYFLENGGLVHFEVYLATQSDTPILELCTPECRSPEDVLRYSRGFDALLTDLSRRSSQAFLERGFHGYLSFGKNNRDRHGTGFGCHENYLVHHQFRTRDRLLLLASLPLVYLLLLPAVGLYVLILAVALTVFILGRLSHGLREFGLRCYDSLRAKERLWTRLIAVCHLGSNGVLYPGIWLFARVLRVVALRPFLRDLTSFLVTRQIIAGAGGLDFRNGCYELSQRAALVRGLAGIVIFGKGKNLYDLKGLLTLLYQPRVLFQTTQRLTITGGDTNLSDVSNWLKLSGTLAVIEMIECGESFEDLRLASPVRALRDIAQQGPRTRVRCRGGAELTALELQHAFLERAERFHTRTRPGRELPAALREWRAVLAALEDDARVLADRLDWAAKLALLEEALAAEGVRWRELFDWGRLFVAAGFEATRAATSFEELVESCPARRRRELAPRLEGLQPSDLSSRRALWLRLQKMDLRYHELNAQGGYHRLLEREGAMRRLVSEAEAERAILTPPADTRARIRGYYIARGPGPEGVLANWHEVELQNPYRQISLPDPFFHRVPGDG